jgi:DNA transposition AAA+ family ATPase
MSQERYMSSPEFAGLQGISGTAVAKRCALLLSPAKRQLLWFIQGMSLTEGGLKKLARELLNMFPERIDPSCIAYKHLDLDTLESDKPSADDLRQECHDVALHRRKRDPDYFSHDPISIEEFLVDLCINPRLKIALKGEVVESSEFDVDLARDEFPELEPHEFHTANLEYFKEVIAALVDYKRRYEERVRAEFCLTAIGQQVWKQLDAALKSKTMIVIDGKEGRGKTEAVRAWCNCHLGVARFASLDGTSTKTMQFRELARSLGVGHGYCSKVSEMQAKVKEVLRVSQLMLVIDEAHYLFNQGPRMYTRPEMLDWIDTALCNPPLPLALITTPQFLICMERAAGQVEWNYRQFRRRCKRYVRLAPKNTPADIEAVARKLLPGADKATIKQIMAYEALSKRDLSAVGDVVREAKLLAEEDKASKVTFEHVKRAIYEVLIVSDVPWAEMEKRLQHQKLGRKAPRHAPAIEPEASQEPGATRGRDIEPRLSPGASRGSRLRFEEADPARVSDPDEAILTPV